MALDNNNEDQKPRTEKMVNEIKLTEKAQRLKMAECYAKGGRWENGRCVK